MVLCDGIGKNRDLVEILLQFIQSVCRVGPGQSNDLEIGWAVGDEIICFTNKQLISVQPQ